MKELNGIEFQSAVGSGKALVDFYTTTCPPCKQMVPIVEAVASRVADVAFFKVNAETNPDLAARFGIRSVPTFLVMQDGVVKGQKTGTMAAAQMERWIADCLESR